MNMIAVGFQNGTVIVIRGNITRDRMSRHRIVHEEKGDRVYVTGLMNHNIIMHDVVYYVHALVYYIHTVMKCLLQCMPSMDTVHSHLFSKTALHQGHIHTLVEWKERGRRSERGERIYKPIQCKCVYMYSLRVPPSLAGLGFRQVGQRTFLMISTNKKVYSIFVSENDKKVNVRTWS